jgi:hypothetical protein
MSRFLRATALIVLIVLVAAMAFAVRYRGFTRAGVDYIMNSSLHERLNVAFMLLYWTEFVGRMQPDVDHFYTFDNAAGTTTFDQALIEYHRGNFASSVSGIQQDIAAQGESEKRLFWLGMSQLRRGEAVNCLSPVLHAAHEGHQAEYCALPISRFHEDKQYARAAAATFERLLNNYANDNRLYQWLLNYSCMLTNDFPARVPKQYLISDWFIDKFYGAGKQKTAQDFSWLKFDEKAGQFGINTLNAGRGVAIEDFDGDGYLDIVTGGSFDDLRFYHNEGGQTFTDWTDRVGFKGIRQPFFISVADTDNDGWPDLLVTRMFHDGVLLLHNNGNGTFSDTTASSGLANLGPPNGLSSAWAPAWADVNNDGRLDLVLTQMGMDIPFAPGLLARPHIPSALYINEGGKFVNRTAEYGLTRVMDDHFYIGAAFGDYNGDGYPDLFLSSPVVGESVLLKNVDGKRFEKSAAFAGRNSGFSAAFLDVNHDGKLDIFQGGFSDARSSIEMAMYREDPDRYRSGKSAIYLQQSDGRFQEQKDFFDMPGGTMGASFGDVNNDGCYDFYLGTGSPEGWFIFPKLMFLGVPQGTGCAMKTSNVSTTNSFALVQKGHGIVFFDFNNDGLQDIYSSLGGMWPADRWPNQFFVNHSEVTNSWIKIRLRGRHSNRMGVGAIARVAAQNAKHEAILRYAYMDQKTAFGSGPYLLHVGLGNATVVDHVNVYWPASGCRHDYAAEINKLNILDEQECTGK